MSRYSERPEEIDVAVLGGAGHVGLPLSLLLADSGLNTLVYDADEEALRLIGSGRMPHVEHDAEPLLARALESGRLGLTSDVGDLEGAAASVIAVAMPVDEYVNPVHRVIRDCVDSLLPYVDDGHLIVLRSTVYPGTTDWLARYVNAGEKEVRVAFCPERVVQGHAIREIREIPQIIGASSADAVADAKRLFGRIVKRVVCMAPMEAEFAKLFGNAVRYVQFALSNEFYRIASAAGLDYNRIFEGMTENYPRALQHVRAGFAAGPNLLRDTRQLAAFAKSRFSLGAAAIQVNEGLVHHVVDRMCAEHDLTGMTVGLLGMAFKADSDDTRLSLSYKMRKILALHANRVIATDPFVTHDPDLQPLDTVIEESDILVLCTPHSVYRGIDTRGTPLVDVWGFLQADPGEPER